IKKKKKIKKLSNQSTGTLTLYFLLMHFVFSFSVRIGVSSRKKNVLFLSLSSFLPIHSSLFLSSKKNFEMLLLFYLCVFPTLLKSKKKMQGGKGRVKRTKKTVVYVLHTNNKKNS